MPRWRRRKSEAAGIRALATRARPFVWLPRLALDDAPALVEVQPAARLELPAQPGAGALHAGFRAGEREAEPLREFLLLQPEKLSEFQRLAVFGRKRGEELPQRRPQVGQVRLAFVVAQVGGQLHGRALAAEVVGQGVARDAPDLRLDALGFAQARELLVQLHEDILHHVVRDGGIAHAPDDEAAQLPGQRVPELFGEIAHRVGSTKSTMTG